MSTLREAVEALVANPDDVQEWELYDCEYHDCPGCEEPHLTRVEVVWTRRLTAILAAPAPDTDALAERPVNQWAHVLDDMGSADFYDTEQDARQMRDLCGGGVDRVETYPVVPFGPALTPTQPAEPTQSDAGEVGR